MTTSLPDAVFATAAAQIESWQRPLLLTHAKPDGDALGAVSAMNGVLRHRGADPVPVVYDDISDRYSFLIDGTPLKRLGVDVSVTELDSLNLDGVIVLDTCSFGQLAPVADWLRDTAIPKFVVDHHVTRDDFADGVLIDETASAACLILWEWFRNQDWSIDATIAQALFVGIATDTGWFRHSNTDARTLSAAAELVQQGVQPFAVYDSLFQHESLSRFKLRAVVTSNLELYADGALAVMTLPTTARVDAGAALADTEDLVNEPLRVNSTLASVFLVEQDDGVIRVGFRSRAPLTNDGIDVDVAGVAQHFGGGGHRRAAGARITASMEEARRQVVEHMKPLLTRTGN